MRRHSVSSPAGLPGPWWVPLTASGFALATFTLSVGLELVEPTRFEWLLYGGDPQHHFFGWHLFRRGPWGTPAGATPLLMWPLGSSVGLTDSIPLLAFVFKAFSGALPAVFQYQGLWLLACFALQGAFAALLMRVATRRPELQLLGACLCAMSPPMLHRLNHEALSAHWLILWALCLSVKPQTSAPLLSWAVVGVLSAAVHPYLAMMIAVLMAAAHAREAIVTPAATLAVGLRLVLIAGVMGLTLWQCGYFIISGDDLQGERFGYFSMNLLSPVLPFSAYDAAARGGWQLAKEGQYEGLAYLGAGQIALLVVAVATLPRVIAGWSVTRASAFEFLPLTLGLGLLFLLALGPEITLGSWTLFAYDPGWWGPLTLFRASGRMVWPVYYATVLMLVVATVRVGHARCMVILSIAVLLQAWDVSDTYRSMRSMRAVRFVDPLTSRFWDVAADNYARIVLVPTRLCTAEDTFDFKPFAMLAGRHGIAINVGFASRLDRPGRDEYCRAFERDVAAGRIDPDSLYVVRRDLVEAFKSAAGPQSACLRLDGHDVCVVRDTILRWQDQFDPMHMVLPAPDELLAFHEMLDREYRVRLRRPPRPRASSTADRLTRLTRYVWYRQGGCADEEAIQRALKSPDRDVRMCGDPFRRPALPPPDDTFKFLQRLETSVEMDAHLARTTTHVDVEGEAVWVQHYISERLAGRDQATAREVVMSRLRLAAP